MKTANLRNVKRRRFIKNFILSASSTILIPPILESCSQLNDEEKTAFIPQGEFGFLEGLASFDPSEDGIILWTRYSPAENEKSNPTILVEMAMDIDFNDKVVSEHVEINFENDNTLNIEINNLKSFTNYYYRFTNPLTGAITPVGTTKTLPSGNEISKIQLAFTSCANFELGYFNVYDAIMQTNADYVIHLGDYIYEGYRKNHIQGRNHNPEHELETLEDYRIRYKQYRKDPSLQKLHRTKPFICVWDDHEFTNNAYKDGSPVYAKNDSAFLKRKESAIQAWHEYLPSKSIQNDTIFRSFKFGNLLSLFMLDTRLIGRDEQLNYKNYISDGTVNEQFYIDLNNTERSILGTDQKNWLIEEIIRSSSKWNVIGSQVLMGKHYFPAELIPLMDKAQKSSSLTEDEKKEYIKQITDLIEIKTRALNGDPNLTADEISRIENILPYNLDSWDGYPSEREEIYQAIQGRKIITFSGASHNAWHNELKNNQGELVGHEFATSSVTSQGLEGIFGQDPIIVSAVEQTNVTLMDDVKYSKLNKRGFIKAAFSSEAVDVDWIFVDNIDRESFDTFSGHTFSIK